MGSVANQQSIDEFLAALREGKPEAIAAVLVKQPALAKGRDGAGVSLLLQACYFRQVEALEMLLCMRAGLDVFEAAALGGGVAQLANLLETDSSLVAAWSADGFTPLHLAAYFGGEKAARMLVEHGADVNVVSRNAMKLTPLHSAAISGSLGIVRLLVEKGADVNVQQHGGWTPLHAAAHNGDEKMVEFLLSCGADTAAKSADGKTPADVALARDHKEVSEMLKGRKT